MIKQRSVQLHPADNVAVALENLALGQEIGPVKLRDSVRMAHKFALRDINQGERILKFGQTIGFAARPIKAGDWIHTHNVSAEAFARDCQFSTEVPPPPTPIVGRTFQGYRRANGLAGTRNYVAIISSVNCSASVSKYVAARFGRDRLQAFPNVDGVIALTHKGGCGIQADGLEHQILARTLTGMARHPNVGAYLLIGLGCETNQIKGLLRQNDSAPVLVMQSVGGTARTVEAAVAQVEQLLPQANAVRREAIPASEIVLGLNCGGSDGSSGITANPALGVAADMLIAAGGTAILGETTEIYGAEHLLTRRAVSEAVGRKLMERIRWWEKYTEFFGVTINNNPSAGNKEGGLTTIYEKSLGAVAKAGSTALTSVVEYAEPVTAKGLVFMDGPSFDPVSVTSMVAGGANVVCFTTGRGSCYGCKPVPSIKIATNTPMYQHMIEDMDLNAGVIYDGVSIAEVGKQIFEEIIAVASGRKTKSELHGLGDEEFAPWSIGPTL